MILLYEEVEAMIRANPDPKKAAQVIVDTENAIEKKRKMELVRVYGEDEVREVALGVFQEIKRRSAQ